MNVNVRIQPMKGNDVTEMAILSRDFLPELGDHFRFITGAGTLSEGIVKNRIFDHSSPNHPKVILLLDIISH